MNATDLLVGAAFGDDAVLPDVPNDVMPAVEPAAVLLPDALAQAIEGLADAEIKGARAVAFAVATAVRRLRRVPANDQPAIADILGKAFADALKAREHAQAAQRAADFRAILRAAVADPEFKVPEAGLQVAAKAARAVFKLRSRAANAGRQAAAPQNDVKAIRAAMRLVYAWARDNDEALSEAVRNAAAKAAITLV